MPPLMLDMAPPSSSPPHNPLSIRTAKQGKKSIQQAPSSSSSQQPYPEYPIKIPPEKQSKAGELYNTFILAEMLAQNDTVTHNDGYLLPTGPSIARSVTSQTSSKHRGAPSTSASTYDAITDYGSVVSFNQSPTSATELTSFDGKKVRTRKRKRLSPKARAKAALVRYLGSCQPCRSRRVPCPLDHHDIQFLESLRLSMPKEEIRPEPQPSPLSAASSSSQRTARSITKQEPASSSSVSDAFLGIGANLLETVDAMDFDKQLDMDILSSVAGGSYDNTQTDRPAPAMLNPVAPNLPILNDPNPYATFKDGAPFLLGCLRNDQFHCQHLQLCQERLNTADELQDHFATAHFEFTRIDPAHLFICSVCNYMSLSATDVCSCGTTVNIELWICGHFIKRPWFQRDSSDGTDFQGYRPGSNSFDSPSFGGPNGSLPWDPNMNNRGNFGGGVNNQGPSNYQGGYDRTGNQGFGWNNSNGSGSGSNQYQGNFGARQIAWDGQFNFQIWCLKAHPRGRRLNSLLLLLLLLFAITFGFTHDWMFTKAHLAAASIRSHLPVLGFAILMTSIVVPLLIQHFNFRRARCVSITIILDHQAKKHADDLQRDLDVLCTRLQTLLYHLHTDQSDLTILCVVSLAYDTKGGNDFTLTPSMKHELQRPP